MLLEACGKLAALKHMSDPQHWKGVCATKSHKNLVLIVPNHWTKVLNPNWRTASEIDDDKRELLRKNFPDCQKLLGLFKMTVWKKLLTLFGVSPTSFRQRLRRDVIKSDISDLKDQAGFSACMSCSHTYPSCYPYFFLLLAMMAAGHDLHCWVSMYSLLAAEFHSGYAVWCQFTSAMGCHP